jgi:hypothetical protein
MKKRQERQKITQLVEVWQNKEVIFPSNMVFTRYGVDTVNYQVPNAEYKVLVYTDSMGCTSCKLQLSGWKELIAYTDSATNGRVPFLFFFHPKTLKELRFLLKGEVFDKPVCIDLDDRLNKLNKFPSNMTFQTFLLDKNNKVLVIGNPVNNAAVKDLYMQQITEQKE